MLRLLFLFSSVVVCAHAAFDDDNDDYQYNHHNNYQTANILAEVHRQCPRITKLFTVGETPNGNWINGIIFGVNPGEHIPMIPEFKYVSSIHGNEVVGKEMLLRLSTYLCNEYNDHNVEIVQLIALTRIHIVPIMNPDGWNTAITSSYDDRNNVAGRTNNNSIDMNRNFPALNQIAYNFAKKFPWINNHLMPFLKKSDHPVQPEVAAMMEWIDSEPFVLSACLHGGDLVVNYPYDEASNPEHPMTPTPDHELFKNISLEYARRHPRMQGSKCYPDEDGFRRGITNGAEWYSFGGSMQDYNYLATNCFEVTIEMECIKFPKARHLRGIWEDHREALIAYMWQTHIGIKGLIIDQDKNPIEDAVIHVAKYHLGSYEPYKDIWHDITSNEEGDYYRLLLNGVYRVTVEKDGYKSVTRHITVQNNMFEPAMMYNFVLHMI